MTDGSLRHDGGGGGGGGEARLEKHSRTQVDMERGKVGMSLQRSTISAAYASGLCAGAGTRSSCENSTSASSDSCLYGNGSPAGSRGGPPHSMARMPGLAPELTKQGTQ